MISVRFQGKPFNITVNLSFSSVQFSSVAQSCLTPSDPIDCRLLRPWDLPGKEYWSGLPSPSPPGVTGKFGLGVQNEAGQRLIEFCQENALLIANTLFQQHKRRLYIWTSPDGQHWNQINYNLCSQNWGSSIQSVKARFRTDCGTDHEFLIAKFRLKLKKVGETTRPFRYDLNQIPYNYTTEVRNRFKVLDLLECLMNYGWRFVTLYRSQGSRPLPRKRNAKRQNGCLGRLYKQLWKEEKGKQRRKENIYPFECRVPKNSKKR